MNKLTWTKIFVDITVPYSIFSKYRPKSLRISVDTTDPNMEWFQSMNTAKRKQQKQILLVIIWLII